MNWNNKVKDWFSKDGVADKWDQMYASDTDALDEYFFRQRRAFTLDYITENCTKDYKILDLGCGAGPVISSLRELGYDCCGMDYSYDMLKLAKERIATASGSETLVVQSDAHATPFKGEHFDFVVCLGVISYLEDYSALLSEIKRVLKPGGSSIITFRNKYNPILSDPVSTAGWIVRKLIRRNTEDNSLGRFLSPNQVKRDIVSAGLDVIGFHGIGFGPFSFYHNKLMSNARGKRLSDSFARISERMHFNFLVKYWTDVSIYIAQKS